MKICSDSSDSIMRNSDCDSLLKRLVSTYYLTGTSCG